MHRLIVAFLAAFDAAIAVAVGIAATLAPLTLLWVFGLGDSADWGVLWPASAVVWQFGHLVPLAITLPGDYLAAAGIDESAASFTLSLAPLAFATFTAIFAARSGARASRADAWLTGVLTGTVVVAVLATLIALSSRNPLASVQLWQAVVFPVALFAVPALLGALATEWREAGNGSVARIRDRVEAWRGGWGDVIGVSTRAAAVAVVGLIGVGALVLFVAVVLRAGDIVALYQAGNLDLVGAIVVTLAQFAYLPTLVAWGTSFAVGPGFGLGEGTAVSPSGTQVAVVPGIPVLGAIPESTSSWMLLLVLLPVAVGALAGWVARSRLLVAAGFVPRARPRREKRQKNKKKTDVAPGDAGSSGWVPVGGGSDGWTSAVPAVPVAADSAATQPLDSVRRATLDGLLASQPAVVSVRSEPAEAAETADPVTAGTEMDAAPRPDDSAPRPGGGGEPRKAEDHHRAPHPHEPLLPRLVVALAIALIAAGVWALFALFASGSFGPGNLAHIGPEPGPVALAVGLEVLVGASILLLASRRGSDDDVALGGDVAAVSGSAAEALDRTWTEGEVTAAPAGGGDAVPAPNIELEAGLGIKAETAPDAVPTPATEPASEPTPVGKAEPPPEIVGAPPTPAAPSAPASRPSGPPPTSEPDAITAPIDLPPDMPPDDRR